MFDLDRSREFNAVHFRHGEIRKNKVHLRSAFEQLKRFHSTRGGNRCESESVDRSKCGLEDCCIVINDHDGRQSLGLGTLPWVDRKRLRVGWDSLAARQEHLHRRTFTDARRKLDASARLPGETKHLSQTES
jgi:hypothetical protein